MTLSKEQYPHDNPEIIAALRREAESFGVNNEPNEASDDIPKRAYDRQIIDIIQPSGLSEPNESKGDN